MTTVAWVTMGIICTIVWGGFITFLVRALRFEGQKWQDDAEGR